MYDNYDDYYGYGNNYNDYSNSDYSSTYEDYNSWNSDSYSSYNEEENYFNTVGYYTDDEIHSAATSNSDLPCMNTTEAWKYESYRREQEEEEKKKRDLDYYLETQKKNDVSTCTFSTSETKSDDYDDYHSSSTSTPHIIDLSVGSPKHSTTNSTGNSTQPVRKSSSTDSTSNKPAASHKSSYTATKTKTAAKAETRNEQKTSRFESVLRILPLHLYKVFCWIIGLIAHFSVDVYDNGANSFTIMSTILFLIALYFAYFKNEKRLRKIPMLMFSIFTYYSLKYIHTIWMYVG